MAFKDKVLGSAKIKIVAVLIIVLFVGVWLGRIGAPEETVTEKTIVTAQAKPQLWTCSMHPQFKLPKPGLCPSCNMELIPLVLDDSDADAGLRQLVVSDSAMALMDVEVAPVERKFVEAAVRMTGKVDYDETNLAYITAWVPGRLDKLYVDYTGVSVNKGDHMVYLYSPELIGAQEELLQAIEAVKNMRDTELGVMREMTAATVDAAREKLRLWGLKAEQIAEIEKTATVTDHMTVYSPTSGIVIHKNAVEGMYVQTGTQIYTIADLSKVWVMLDAYESDLEWLRYGQDVEFTTVSSPGVAFRGTISFIDPMLNEMTRTVKVRVNVSNNTGRLKPGMFVKAVVRSKVSGGGQVMDVSLAGKWICPMHPEIIKDSSDKCDICGMDLVRTEELGYLGGKTSLAQPPLVIPVTAALITGSRAVVYVRLPNTDKPTFEGREIVLGPRAGDYYLVRSGLKEGELVVARGNFKIDSSLQIMAKPSMMTPDGSGGTIEDGALGGLTKFQMLAVIEKANEIQTAVRTEDADHIRQAFKDLAASLIAVDKDVLTSQVRVFWDEYLNKFGNDAVEGIGAKTLQEAIQAEKSLSLNILSFALRFGLVDADSDPVLDKISDSFRNQLASVFDGYFVMQKALANDDFDAANKSAKKMLESFKTVDMKLLTRKDHDVWMKNASKLKEAIAKLTQAKDIEKQRESFNLISQSMVIIARHFGSVVDGPIYIDHCAMAFDNAGADWLQIDKRLLNPYYGASMLRCGSIEDVVGVDSDRWESDKCAGMEVRSFLDSNK